MGYGGGTGGPMRRGPSGEPHVRRSIRWGGTQRFAVPAVAVTGPSASPLGPLLAYVQDTHRPLTWSVLTSFEFDTDVLQAFDPSIAITLYAQLKVGTGQANVTMTKSMVVNVQPAPPVSLLPPGSVWLPPQTIQWDVVPAENIQVQAFVYVEALPPEFVLVGSISGMCAPYFMLPEEGDEADYVR